jgi:soluble lytic murein transglycosylase
MFTCAHKTNIKSLRVTNTFVLSRMLVKALALPLLCVTLHPQLGSANNTPPYDTYANERKLYLDAKIALNNNDQPKYQHLKHQLNDYPLQPYLEYTELSKALDIRRLSKSNSQYGVTAVAKANKKKITQFVTQHKNSYLGDRLLSKWLYYLAEQKNWPDYKRYYHANVKKTDLVCFHLQAQYRTEGTVDSAAVDKLWLSSKSQPKACDPVFAVWKKQGHLTTEKLWQRYTLAVNKKNPSLAKYLKQKMTASDRYLADLYQKVHSSPKDIRKVNAISTTTKASSFNDASLQHVIDIIENGLYRHTYREPEEARQLFNRFKKTYAFDDEATQRLNNRIARQLIRQEKLEQAMSILKEMDTENRSEQVEYLLRKLLAKQDWKNVEKWILQLPEEQLTSDRWRYWQARSLEELTAITALDNLPETPTAIYQQLSESRSFYGFLSADRQKADYQFEDKPAPVDQALINRLKNSPAFARAKEFLLMEEMHRARTEWRYAVRGLSTEEFIAAAQIANQWGWDRKAIEAMAGAQYWDDLNIRFPVVHSDIIHRSAKKHDIPSSLVFSIARQESAWEFDAKSRVGARGLMQIMPATAKETAKKARLAYKKGKLFEPAYNITLGSHYITGLLEQYEDNRALAIASYNAGPHRVKQWLKRSNASLPLDVWIEIIPFKETRKYVQNVLSYEVIYNYRQGRESNLLTLAEANSIL